MSIERSTARPAVRRRVRRAGALAVAAAAAVALAGCSLTAGDTGADGAASGSASGTVVLVTHDSFALPDDLIAQFEADTGLTLEQRAPGDAGTLVNQLVLTKDDPIGDVVFGIDNTFASRAIDAGVLTPYSPELPAGADQYLVDDQGSLTPIDVGDVCVNADLTWFDDHGLAVPQTLDDLADPAYADLLTVENPASSSPGLAWLLATIGAKGEDGWQAYWQSLVDNGVSVAASWSDAYYVDFSGPSSEGERPLVVSYASSPPYEVPEGSDTAPTAALLDTCFRQVEYAGVIAGAANPEGAQEVVDWLLSPEVQAAIPESMYVYPVDSGVALPDSWAQFAPLATAPFTVDPARVAEMRDTWIQDWTALVVG
ncbi:thiamine ABC transporter substrate-binding protein [Actinotalea sp. M2MS4P-6]|uniref:thiamine ABC transporter substrate-binding protein n=1 Tax=Actinotalea sp. M2MS4P-6 TaxID=2983762 RepID=UPI0021E3E5D7|nr:thiamine ABC transporter substrate-binding protein [Actinotalea sp. M2MS4P-6]MCV2392996.1 thiamine ABC transporter substrate-binding protein [Actinotalea sp. M2MS4P-6]